jgi:uncharacterized repeat protein (TIGR01451 family)
MKPLISLHGRRFDRWGARLLLLASFAYTSVLSLMAQEPVSWWTPVAAPPGAASWAEPPAGRHYQLDRRAAWSVLQRAPVESGATPHPGAVVVLPRPDGRFERFEIVEAPVMAPELAARYPDIKTYVGRGLDDPAATVRVGWSAAGFYAQVLSAHGSYYVDPRQPGDAETHLSYFARDVRFAAPGFTCHVAGEAQPPARLSPDIARRAGPTLRSYRVAIATTGEFTTFHGGVAGALNAVVQIVNRLTGIYEVEVGVRLTLVANNDLVIFPNAATDPFTNADSFSMLFQVQPVLDSVIGPQNYDVGHVFGTDFAPNGVAFLRAACAPTLKGSGVSLAPNPVPDGSWVMVAAHELGHQFGANHTFNGINGGCGPNRNAATAYEPGSGTTIMSYSSICGPDNLKGLEMMDPYFHSISFDEITAHITGAGGSCAVTSSTGNNAPLVSAGTNYFIPARTPFRLTAQAADPDGDFVTYSWEQRDLGPATNLTAGDIGAGPLFRVFNPTSSPVRIFPKLDSLLTGTPSLGETLPVLGRTLNFRVTARDGRPGGGGVNTADMQLTVVSNAGPFLITAPGTSANYAGLQTVTWNVAGTTNAPINVSNVNIRFSVDGGRTFPILLAANTPNDGAETVDVPPVPTTRGRVMVEAVSNVFFDISDNDLVIPPGSQQADLQLSVFAPTVAAQGASFSYLLVVSNAGPDLAAPVVLTNYLPASVSLLSVSNSSGSVTVVPGAVELSSGVLSNGQTIELALTVRPNTLGFITNVATVSSSVPDPFPANNSALKVTSVVGPTPELFAAGAAVVEENFSPLNGVIEIGERVTVGFAIQNAGSVDAPAISAQLLPGGGVTSPSGAAVDYGTIPAGGVIERPMAFTATGTNGGTITAILLIRQAGIFVKTIPYSFPLPDVRTFTHPGGIVISNVNAASPYPSTITVTNLAGQIARVTVTLNKFSHSFPDDVDLALVSPTGQKAMLFSDAGGGQPVTNLVITLDDAATNALPDAFGLSGGNYRPADYEPGEHLIAPAPAGPYPSTFTVFNQQPPNGTWSLYVQDDTVGDAGSISGGWALQLATVAPLNPPGDLRLSLSASNTTTVVGVPLTYTLSVSNLGPAVANAVTVLDTLPAGSTFVDATVSQGGFTNLGGQVRFHLGSLATNAVATATLTVLPGQPGFLTNLAAASAARTELTPADNTASVVTTVEAPAPLIIADGAILVAEGNSPPNGAVDPGETVTVRLRLRNTGTADTTNLVATLQPAGGVQSPAGAQTYGVLVAGAGPGSADFSFTAANLTNGLITATLTLQDGAANLGLVQFVFSLGGSGRFSSTVPIIINDATNAAPYPSAIVVSNVAGVISRVAVVLSNFTHSFPDDVDVLLVGPLGERVVLMSDAGGSVAVNAITLTLDDAAAQSLPDVSGLTTGSFRPTNHAGDAEAADVWPAPAPGGPYAGALAEFAGTDPNGVWSLYVRDDSGGDAGVIAGGWALLIETVSPVSDSADLQLTGIVSTNEIVAGNFLTFAFTVTNKGPADATLVLLSNTVPAGTRLFSAFQSQGTLLNVNGQLLAQLGTVPRNGAASLSLVLAPQVAGIFSNVAAVSAAEVDFALANNRATLFVHALPAPPPVLGPSAGVTTNATFEFALNGQPALSYAIEASTNLVDWVAISTNLPVGGRILFTDTNAAAIPERFYRARQLP